ncbi:AfsR/SARP family transcriptional regulator [Streptomyces sp. NBC_01142]|uniref:AfsR/SARP family transcriptional regulator n=1 Tax=Streptomyces sp. NBC_01142 TaxID=2975865 RepID=UPI0022596F92|nr:AfsR/SARP family transcriptional regulator [Streptomyces sp. NBC_01142]MCX4824936.1 AfsR/SARP family transcriptional regulator [Streptomyces sp. NBC_01142]
MEIKVLGQLSVSVRGRSVVPQDGESRRVLALLALSADQVVPTSSIIQELWPEGPPRSADSRLRSHVDAVRGLLSDALRTGGGGAQATGADLLISTPGGYRLDSRGGPLDARQFERDTGAGYRALAGGYLRRAAVRLRDALSLWTGDALAELEQTGPLRVQTSRLQEARMAALEQWAAVELQLGHHRERLAELGELTARHRTHQGLHRHYMTALHLCGRPAEALRVYERLTDTLAREGGPGPSLQLLRLRRRILAVPTGPGCTAKEICRPRLATTG